MMWATKSCTGITSWRAGESCPRLQHRAAAPAHTHGEVKEEGAHPASESSSTMVGKDAVSSSLQRRALAGWLENSQDGPSGIHGHGAGASKPKLVEVQAREEGESEDHLAPCSVSCLCMGTPQESIRVKMLSLGCTIKSDKSQINSEFSVPGGTRRWRKLTSSILLSMVTGNR